MIFDDDTLYAFKVVSFIIAGLLTILIVSIVVQAKMNNNYHEKHDYSFKLDDEQFERILNVLESGKDGEK